MIEEVKKEVEKLLNNDNSGHGIDHINRVLNLSLKFNLNEKANEDIISLIALLHDVDDYKLFGIENSKNLTNAKNIMNKFKIDKNIQNIVCNEINNIGYSKRLKGCIPNTIEGKIVSDADMCDAIGTHGILRTYQYNLSKNRPFFDKDIYPIEDINEEKYKQDKKTTCICHFFEKILKLKDLMLTESGKKEALKRHKITVDFLYNFFEEEDTKEWSNYLTKYLKK